MTEHGYVRNLDNGDLVNKEKKIRISRLTSDEDLDKWYKLRCRIFTKAGRLDPADYPDNKDIDGHDDNSLVSGIWYEERLVGGARLVQSEILPMEEAVKIENKRGNSFELSRFLVEDEFRNEPDLFNALLVHLYNYSLENECMSWYAIVITPLFRLVKQLKHRFEVISPKVIYLKKTSIGISFNLHEQFKMYNEEYPEFLSLIDNPMVK